MSKRHLAFINHVNNKHSYSLVALCDWVNFSTSETDLCNMT